ncbi:MAG: hypothetical protein AMXMBFR64_45590 [Myxococcales bacterium]
MKASELRKSLTDAKIATVEIDRMVGAQVAAGAIENDEAPAPSSPVSDELFKAVDAATNQLRKSMDGSPAASPQPADVSQAPKDVSGGDMSKAVDVFAKGADAILQQVGDQHRTLAGGYLALGQLNQAMAKALTEQGERLAAQDAKLDTILKALSQPVPLRSVTGLTTAVPAPGETPTGPAKSTHAAVLQKAMGEMQNPSTTMDRRRQLASAVALLDSHGDPAEIAASFGITVG